MSYYDIVTPHMLFFIFFVLWQLIF